MNTVGHYRLALQSGGIGFFAEVEVTVTECDNASIVVSDTAFAWLKESYGPDAWEWPVCDSFRAAAVRAAEFALAHLATPRLGLGASINVIRTAPADTTADCVAYATCCAIWDALQDPGSARVEIVGRRILFGGLPLLPGGHSP